LSPLDWHGSEARRLVEERFAKLLLREEVVDSLRADAALRDEVRQVALQLAEEHDEDPIELDKAAYAIVRKPGAGDADLRRALRRVEAACRLFPSNGVADNTLALVRHRLGEYDQALAALARAEPHNVARFGGPWPRDLAVRALAQVRLGRIDQAKATVAQLRNRLKEPRWANAPEARALLAEATALLEQKEGKDREKAKP